MAESVWVNGILGEISSTEQTFAANTAINIYGSDSGDDIRLQKKGPDNKFYPHKVDGSDMVGGRNSSFILLVAGIYKIVGKSKKALYITYEAN